MRPPTSDFCPLTSALCPGAWCAEQPIDDISDRRSAKKVQFVISHSSFPSFPSGFEGSNFGFNLPSALCPSGKVFQRVAMFQGKMEQAVGTLDG